MLNVDGIVTQQQRKAASKDSQRQLHGYVLV